MDPQKAQRILASLREVRLRLVRKQALAGSNLSKEGVHPNLRVARAIESRRQVDDAPAGRNEALAKVEKQDVRIDVDIGVVDIESERGDLPPRVGGEIADQVELETWIRNFAHGPPPRSRTQWRRRLRPVHRAGTICDRCLTTAESTDKSATEESVRGAVRPAASESQAAADERPLSPGQRRGG